VHVPQARIPRGFVQQPHNNKIGIADAARRDFVRGGERLKLLRTPEVFSSTLARVLIALIKCAKVVSVAEAAHGCGFGSTESEVAVKAMATQNHRRESRTRTNES
jgi:hypothetical protein